MYIKMIVIAQYYACSQHEKICKLKIKLDFFLLFQNNFWGIKKLFINIKADAFAGAFIIQKTFPDLRCYAVININENENRISILLAAQNFCYNLSPDIYAAH